MRERENKAKEAREAMEREARKAGARMEREEREVQNLSSATEAQEIIPEFESLSGGDKEKVIDLTSNIDLGSGELTLPISIS